MYTGIKSRNLTQHVLYNPKYHKIRLLNEIFGIYTNVHFPKFYNKPKFFLNKNLHFKSTFTLILVSQV